MVLDKLNFGRFTFLFLDLDRRMDVRLKCLKCSKMKLKKNNIFLGCKNKISYWLGLAALNGWYESYHLGIRAYSLLLQLSTLQAGWQDRLTDGRTRSHLCKMRNLRNIIICLKKRKVFTLYIKKGQVCNLLQSENRFF